MVNLQETGKVRIGGKTQGLFVMYILQPIGLIRG